MIYAASSFASLYKSILDMFIKNLPIINISIRNKTILKEVIGVMLEFNMRPNEISVFSHSNSRVFPIKFALAEFAWFLTHTNTLDVIITYNKVLEKYSDDGKTSNGCYGYRLGDQIDTMITRLVKDKYSRQACCTIWQQKDGLTDSKDIPCNVFLQFFIRDDVLYMIVTSRSSDLITGLLIDCFHWQLYYQLIYNTLYDTYGKLQAGSIQYQIGSLHLYEDDWQIVKNWNTTSVCIYQHELEVSSQNTYVNTHINVCTKFKPGLSVSQLAQLIGIGSVENESTLLELEYLVKNSINKIKR